MIQFHFLLGRVVGLFFLRVLILLVILLLFSSFFLVVSVLLFLLSLFWLIRKKKKKKGRGSRRRKRDRGDLCVLIAQMRVEFFRLKIELLLETQRKSKVIVLVSLFLSWRRNSHSGGGRGRRSRGSARNLKRRCQNAFGGGRWRMIKRRCGGRSSGRSRDLLRRSPCRSRSSNDSRSRNDGNRRLK